MSRPHVPSTARFDESGCQAGTRLGSLLVTLDPGGQAWSASGRDAREPGTGDVVLPSVLAGHPAVGLFVANGVNQSDLVERGYRLEVGSAFVTAASDGEPVLAALREGSVVAELYAEDGTPRRELVFPSKFDACGFFRFDDFNGNGSDELGVVGLAGDGRTVVNVVDSADGQTLVTWDFVAKYQPSFLAVTDDLDGNGAEDLALLGTNLDGQVRVDVRDGKTGERVALFVYGKALRPAGFVAVPDRDGRRTWLSMLGTRADGKTTAVTRDAVTGELVGKAWFGRNHVPVAFSTYRGFGIADGGALVFVGVASSGEHRVLVKTAATGARLARFPLPRRYTPFDVTEVYDYGDDGVPDLLFVAPDLDGAVRLGIYDPVTGEKVRGFFAD